MIVLERRKTVATHYLRGMSQWEIAREVGVTQSTVSEDLKAVRSEWLAAAVRDFDAARSEEIAKLDALEVTYWQAWNRSLEDRVLTKETQRTLAKKKNKKTGRMTGGGKQTTATIEREGKEGNPAFLAGVQSCIQKRCELLRLVEPQKNENHMHLHLSVEERRTKLLAIFEVLEQKAAAAGVQLPYEPSVVDPR